MLFTIWDICKIVLEMRTIFQDESVVILLDKKLLYLTKQTMHK